MQQGTPQGSPLSPVLWLVQISLVLHDADARFAKLAASYPRPRRNPPPPTGTQLDLMSYVDDGNPLIITSGSHRHHKRVRHWVDTFTNGPFFTQASTNCTITPLQSFTPYFPLSFHRTKIRHAPYASGIPLHARYTAVALCNGIPPLGFIPEACLSRSTVELLAVGHKYFISSCTRSNSTIQGTLR